MDDQRNVLLSKCCSMRVKQFQFNWTVHHVNDHYGKTKTGRSTILNGLEIKKWTSSEEKRNSAKGQK